MKIFIKRKIFEYSTKVIIRCQGVSIVSGKIIYECYRDNVKQLWFFKNYIAASIPGVDGYVVRKRSKESSEKSDMPDYSNEYFKKVEQDESRTD